MSIFDGHTLRGPRVAPANSKTTASVTGGVCEDVKHLVGYSDTHKLLWGDNLVRPYVDQYRSAILEGRDGHLEEYLVFSANSSSLSVVEDPAFPITSGKCSIPTGSEAVSTEDQESYSVPLMGTLQLTSGSNLLVGVGTTFTNQLVEGAYVGVGVYHFRVESITHQNEAVLESSAPVTFSGSGVAINPVQDGSTRLVLSDNGNRSIAGVLSLTFIRGDDTFKIERKLTVAAGDITCSDPESGLIQVNTTPTTHNHLRPVLGSEPSFSKQRGDRIIEVEYYLASPRFWWTKNDPELERFHYVGKRQRWEPLKGSSPLNLGRLLPDKKYELKPRPQNLTIGGYLPGLAGPTSGNFDQYAMVRLGSMPNANSIPMGDEPTSFDYRGIEIVPDEVAESGEYDFGARDPAPVAIVGQTNGVLIWNPAIINLYAGQIIWYNPKTFNKKSTGSIGKLADALNEPLFVSPIPGWSDHTLLRIDSRRYLKMTYCENDSGLPNGEDLEEGSAALSLSTGRLQLSSVDITKAVMGDVDAPNPDFNKQYSGATVVYDGLVMNRVAQPVKSPVQLGKLNK